MLEKMERGQVKAQFAKEYFNGTGKIQNNAKLEMQAIILGFPVEVPLLGIKLADAESLLDNPQRAKKMLGK
jgi:hypothetical protein